MKRRTFLASTLAITFQPHLLRAAEPLAYSPGSAEAAMGEGKIVLLDFSASWCATCATQDRVLTELKAENPAYEQKILFYIVDWDAYGNGPLAKSLQIPRRSTLVALKGQQEVGRIIAGTAKADIKSLLDSALVAAG